MRARNIKPSFFMNEELAELDAGCRLLFIGLWCLADREGLLKYRPKRIWAELFPYNQTFEPLVAPWLHKLMALDFLGFWYDKHDNVVLIEILNFSKHQRPHQREKASELKPLTDGLRLGVSKDSPRCPDTGYLIPDTGYLNTSCPELEESSTEPDATLSPKPNPLLSIPLNKRNTFFDIFQEDVDEWQDTFPGVDVIASLKKARQWSVDNPNRRKTKSGIRRHLSTWLDREQNQAKSHVRPAGTQKASTMSPKEKRALQLLGKA